MPMRTDDIVDTNSPMHHTLDPRTEFANYEIRARSRGDDDVAAHMACCCAGVCGEIGGYVLF
jgi:hypothetical protein